MSSSIASRPQFSDRIAPVMFSLSLLFLLVLAALIVVWIDMPRVAELAALEVDADTVTDAATVPDSDAHDPAMSRIGLPDRRIGQVLLSLLLGLWLLFPLEQLLQRRFRSSDTDQQRGRWFDAVLVSVIPPWRLGAPVAAQSGRIWLPGLHWRVPNRGLSRLLARRFSTPMLIIALLILPVLLIEYGLSHWVEQHDWLRLLLHVSTGFIWFAFTVEFIILVGATDKKIAYVRKNWIDLAIILLPLISFLRSIRALRLARLAKVQRLAKVSRIYRLRGLTTKVLRALMLLEVVNRLLRITPEKKLMQLEQQHAEKLEELKELETRMQDLRASISHNADERVSEAPTRSSGAVDQPSS